MSILKSITIALKNKLKIIRSLVRQQIVGNMPRSVIEIASNFVFAEVVEGDYLEFGVFRGGSFIEAYKVLEKARETWNDDKKNYHAYTNKERAKTNKIALKKDIRYFAFDSFEGLPEPKGVDKGSARFSRGRYDCPEEEFSSILNKNGLDLSKVIIVPGFYDKTLNRETKKRYNIKAASIVFVDCDLYESTKYVLDFITDLVVDGTVIIFDGWFDFKGHPEKGEPRATKEWLEKNPHIHLSEYHLSGEVQKSFMVSILNKGRTA